MNRNPARAEKVVSDDFHGNHLLISPANAFNRVRCRRWTDDPSGFVRPLKSARQHRGQSLRGRSRASRPTRIGLPPDSSRCEETETSETLSQMVGEGERVMQTADKKKTKKTKRDFVRLLP